MNPGSDVIWLNGHYIPMDQARISPMDRGFLYGDGLFETIRANGGKIPYLQMHLERLLASLAEFRITPNPMPDWQRIIDGLLGVNKLGDVIAVIKIIVTRGIVPALGLPSQEKPTVCITARQYIPPPPLVYQKGLNLHIFTEGYPPPLARFKSLNYLYYLKARQAALDAGCDDALIVDQRGLVTETSTGSIMAGTHRGWWTPESDSQLPGTTLRALSSIMENEGRRIERRPAGIEDLRSAETVWVLNSLIGIMPVSRIDGDPLSDPAPERAARLRRLLFEQD